jgi:hypothetical protein
MVEQYWVKFDEDGKMKLKLDEVKSDTDTWPTADWTYDEDRVIRIGYKKTKPEINKITVLGKTSKIIQPIEGVFDPDRFIGSKFWAEGEVTTWDETINGYDILFTQTEDYSSYEKGTIRIDCNDLISSPAILPTGGISIRMSHQPGDSIITGSYVRLKVSAGGNLREAGAVITIGGGVMIGANFETRYDQISASVTDPNSIVKYGELDGGTIEYPLLETTEQCENVGKRIIRDSHRQIGQVDFQIPFNPLVQTGQTISITDSKIGLTERYFVEGVNHDINISPDGKVKARTGIEGVLYV